ncbi:MAG TPA: 2,3-diphosphoglycerate-dependent phosphoglycerate mutase [Bacteroidia bacterium]|nr:2,3-diphosphoglycerate-dependent phosphoglycerate mutase [Bacteroidia bacterium]
MSQLVIFRHGQSVWNLENKFTGWVDVELTEKGIEEAKAAGQKLKGIVFNEGYSSDLKRAQNTLKIALEVCGQSNIPITYDKALNERMYGDLQGLNKAETAEKFGEDQVKIWRRSYDVAPPNGESLKDTAARVIPYFEKEIAPKLKTGKNIVIAAHGNSLRALIMHLEKMTPAQILEFEIGTGQPRMYELNSDLSVNKAYNL